MNNFQECLKQGQKYEVETIKYLDYDEIKVMDKYFKEYDIEITKDNKKSYIEVKSEKNATKYNNFALEFSYKNNPSGIDATTADIFFFYAVYPNDTYDVYKVPTKILKQLIKDKKYKRIAFNCGDGGFSNCYLIDRNLFNDYKLKNI